MSIANAHLKLFTTCIQEVAHVHDLLSAHVCICMHMRRCMCHVSVLHVHV